MRSRVKLPCQNSMGRRRSQQNPGREPGRTETGMYDTLISVAEQNPNVEKIDLHGEGVYEAEHAVDQFLHSSQFAGEHVVKIIYGVGTGVLARSIPAYVAKHPMVAYSRTAQGVGGEAGTVVYAVLKQS